MRIPKALEAMVADLISEETKKREEVEGILSQIHEMTEAYFDPEKTEPAIRAAAELRVNGHVVNRTETEPTREPSPQQLFDNAVKVNMRIKGMTEEEAVMAAEREREERQRR